MEIKKPTVLVILDGFGYSPKTAYNATLKASTPNLHYFFSHYPHTTLAASGTAVGLPNGMMGNSEVGHLTIGSGRIIDQPITLLDNALKDGSLASCPLLINALKKLQSTDRTLHLMGLLSDAGVHSDDKILYALLEIAVKQQISKIVVHAFLDGRDVAPESASFYLERLEKELQKLGCGTIGSIHGRFYAMDRDHNWKRTEQSYDVLTTPQSTPEKNWREIVAAAYKQGITDEFIPPTQLDPHTIIKNGDGVIFFNVRPDRARQLTAAFVDPNFYAFPTHKIPLQFFITPVAYSPKLPTEALLEEPIINHTLKEILADHGKTIFSIAETEKYAHVTYFFSGGHEQPYPHESQMLIPSLHTKNYIDNPQMSAPAITSAVLDSLRTSPCDFYLINYANADMVGHSGNLTATIAAVECLDKQIKILYDQVVTSMDGTLYITADHGKAETMFNPTTKQEQTAHTTNPVPFIMIKKGINPGKLLPLHTLADIAPFILRNMGLPIPPEMKRA